MGKPVAWTAALVLGLYHVQGGEDLSRAWAADDRSTDTRTTNRAGRTPAFPPIDQSRLEEVTAIVSNWARDPFVIDSVKARNRETAHLTAGDIAGLDAEWYMESASDSAPRIAAMLANPLSVKLARLKAEGQGLYSEIIVMDDLGLNVGLSDPTTDYWQGDEAKFLETHDKGPGSMYLSDVEFDISSQSFQIQLSLPICDGSKAIGAITVGLNVRALEPAR